MRWDSQKIGPNRTRPIKMPMSVNCQSVDVYGAFVTITIEQGDDASVIRLGLLSSNSTDLPHCYLGETSPFLASHCQLNQRP